MSEPYLYLRMLDGKPDWSEDCVAKDPGEMCSYCDEDCGHTVMPLYTAPESLQAENARLTSEVARLTSELNSMQRPTQNPREFYCRHMAAYVYSCTACDDERRAIDAALAKPCS